MEPYDELIARLAKVERERDKLREHLRYIRDLAVNSHLSAAQKWVLFAIGERLGRTDRECGPLTEINVYEIARDIGMSRERTGCRDPHDQVHADLMWWSSPSSTWQLPARSKACCGVAVAAMI